MGTSLTHLEYIIQIRQTEYQIAPVSLTLLLCRYLLEKWTNKSNSYQMPNYYHILQQEFIKIYFFIKTQKSEVKLITGGI